MEDFYNKLKNEYHIKPLITCIMTCWIIFTVLIWCSGFNFDARGKTLVIWVALLIFSVLGSATCPIFRKYF